MWTVRALLLAVAFAPLAAGCTLTHVSARYVGPDTVDVLVVEPAPDVVVFRAAPTLVHIESNVYVVQGAPYAIYYFNDYYWYVRAGSWYRCHHWDEPWITVDIDIVPLVIVHRDHQRYVHYQGPRGAHVFTDPHRPRATRHEAASPTAEPRVELERPRPRVDSHPAVQKPKIQVHLDPGPKLDLERDPYEPKVERDPSPKLPKAQLEHDPKQPKVDRDAEPKPPKVDRDAEPKPPKVDRDAKPKPPKVEVPSPKKPKVDKKKVIKKPLPGPTKKKRTKS